MSARSWFQLLIPFWLIVVHSSAQSCGMVVVKKLLHAAPHAGNVIVRKSASALFQVIAV